MNIWKSPYAIVLILVTLFSYLPAKAGEVDLLIIADFEQLRNCIDLSPDLGFLEQYRYELSHTADLENKRQLFESIGLKLIRKYGKPTVSIQGCECTPIKCKYSSP